MVYSNKTKRPGTGRSQRFPHHDQNSWEQTDTLAGASLWMPPATLDIAMHPSFVPPGGVWLAGWLKSSHTRRLATRIWLEEIQRNVVSFENPVGTLTNSDLGMAGMLIH
jgi:hypothetical protein